MSNIKSSIDTNNSLHKKLYLFKQYAKTYIKLQGNNSSTNIDTDELAKILDNISSLKFKVSSIFAITYFQTLLQHNDWLRLKKQIYQLNYCNLLFALFVISMDLGIQKQSVDLLYQSAKYRSAFNRDTEEVFLEMLNIIISAIMHNKQHYYKYLDQYNAFKNQELSNS